MATTKKIQTVEVLTEKVSRAKSLVFTDYKGISHKELEELRKALRKVNAELHIAKNRLFLRALGDNAAAVEKILEGETAVLFNFQDEVAGVKELTKFLKTVAKGKAKGGLLGSQPLQEKDVEALANIPAREVLLSQMVGNMQAPIRGLHYSLSWNLNKLVWALNSIKNNKS